VTIILMLNSLDLQGVLYTSPIYLSFLPIRKISLLLSSIIFKTKIHTLFFKIQQLLLKPLQFIVNISFDTHKYCDVKL